MTYVEAALKLSPTRDTVQNSSVRKFMAEEGLGSVSVSCHSVFLGDKDSDIDHGQLPFMEEFEEYREKFAREVARVTEEVRTLPPFTFRVHIYKQIELVIDE